MNRQRPIGLATWLGGGSVVVVAVAVAIMAAACTLLLERLVDQQALTRAQLAATSARDLLRRLAEDTLTDARSLADRPALQRLLADGELTNVEPLLKRFCDAGRGDACAIVGQEGTLHAVGIAAPWDQVRTAIIEQGERFLIAPRDGSAPLWGAAVRLPGLGELRAVVLRSASRVLLADLGRQVGADVRLTNFRTYAAPPDDPLSPVHAAALADGRQAAAPLRGEKAYAATVLVTTVDGEVIALLDARVDGAEFAASVHDFTRVLAIAAVLVAIIAGLAGLAYGRWLARPVEALRDAAVRIGRGDFSAAVPAVAPSEIGALARTMEEMRGNLVDLTATLRHREAEARAVLAGIVEGVFAVDADRHIRYANPQVARMLGRPEGEIIGRFCGDVLDPRLPDGSRPCESSCPILAARAGSQGQAAERARLPDGTTRSLIVVSSPPAGGQQVQVLRDETDLEAVRRARDGVLGNISHEFRTPLAAQLAAIELLRDGVATMDRSAQAELLGNVQRGVLRLMRLIDNLLESVRIESGQLEIRRQALDPGAVMEEAVESVRPLVAQRGLRLEVALPSAGEAIVGDGPRLVQVLVNLLSNAIKFAPEQSAVRVGSVRRADALEWWVEDEGPGVAGDDTDAIFERFRRSSRAEPEAPGLGLGLWIVRSIVARHGGTVRVERTPQSRTRFIVSVPADAPT